jgi:hypothetical protein
MSVCVIVYGLCVCVDVFYMCGFVRACICVCVVYSVAHIRVYFVYR